MNSKVILLFVVLLSSCCSLFAQQQLSYYYHKGEQIVLPINLQHFLVYADVNKISDELFEEEYRVTEWIENGSNGIIEAQVTIPNGNYDSVVNVLKAKDYIVDVEPVIGNNMLINTSRLFYVKLHKSQDYPLLSYMASRTGADIRGKVDYCENWYELCVNKYSAGNSIEATNQFWETGFFEGVDPGFIFHFESASVTTCVSDPRFNEQWGLQAIKACSAWKITTGDTNVRIAVIDKGIDESHREFDSTCVCFSFDMDNCFSHALVYCEIDHERGPDQPHQDSTICVYHGINVGGVIFSNHNRDSIAGVCPKAGLINISHSFKLREDSIASKAARAIIMSVSNGARVINNSWMIKDTISQIASELLEDAIDYALIHNCVVVFAAGNGNNGVSNGCVSYPARCNSQILTVGAVDISLEKTSCSNYGFGLDVVAPGSGILSTHNDNGYNISQGTSMATPHVAGVAGLMFSINPALTGQNVRDIIEQTAYKIPDQLYDTVTENGTWAEYVGYGLLDAHRAVLKAAYHKVYGDTVLTLCDTSTHVYTVRAPHNANIDSVSFFWTCSDNLQMVTGQNTDSVLVKPYNGGIGQLQCHIIHNGDTVVSTMSVSVVSNRTIYDNISLNNNISYPDTFILSRKIVIDSLAGLTWQNKTVLCTPDCKITIRPGGLMTINHTTLTSACLGKMWQGIEVVGNPDKRQIPQWQGVVELKNGATIKNAHCAIRTGLQGDSVYFTTGGIIQADSAFFINNRRSVEFMSYTNHSPAGNVMNNQSYFYRCVFTVDDDNLFGQDNGSFIDHVTMWAVRGVKFRGCDFRNLTTTSGDRRHAIYTDDAGFSVDDYCGANIYVGCECFGYSKSSTFSGFTTAVEVNTSGHQHSVDVNRAQFANNGTGVRVNGNNYVTVTRCDFDLQNATTHNIYGLYLNACTGYLVEGNTFHRTSAPSGNFVCKGVEVANSGHQSNLLHLNEFTFLSHGVFSTGNNSGLQLTCCSFQSNINGIYASGVNSISTSQGAPANGADNYFRDNVISDFYYSGTPSVVSYYYSVGSGHALTNYYGVTPLLAKNANTCASTLCDDSSQPLLAGFQSDMNAYTTASANQSPADGTDGGTVETQNFESLQTMSQTLSETYYTAVRTLMADTVLDLGELEQWHTVAQPIADPYSLTETRFMMGYNEPFVADADDAELSNYADFHALKLALASDNDNQDNLDNLDNLNSQNSSNSPTNSPTTNWYSLTPAQIAQLQTIAERNTGRASVMAKGVLCFFFGICYEDDLTAGVFEAGVDDSDTTGAPTKRAATSAGTNAALSVYPNPAGDLLHIELSGAEIANVALYDLQGRVVETRHGTSLQGGTATVNLRNVPAGVYLLRVRDAEGKEYMRKIVKK